MMMMGITNSTDTEMYNHLKVLPDRASGCGARQSRFAHCLWRSLKRSDACSSIYPAQYYMHVFETINAVYNSTMQNSSGHYSVYYLPVHLNITQRTSIKTFKIIAHREASKGDA